VWLIVKLRTARTEESRQEERPKSRPEEGRRKEGGGAPQKGTPLIQNQPKPGHRSPPNGVD